MNLVLTIRAIVLFTPDARMSTGQCTDRTRVGSPFRGDGYVANDEPRLLTTTEACWQSRTG